MTDSCTEVSPGRAAYELRLEYERNQASMIRDLRAALSSLIDRAEAGQVITGDEADEYRRLTTTAVRTPDPAPVGDPAARLLALELPPNDSGASTVRGYLVALLRIAWEAGDGIHPFGNSGWQHDLYHPMAEAGLARIGYDEDGYATESEAADSYVEANTLILAAIAKLGEVTS